MDPKFKSFTDGLAIFLAILIAIYLMVGFIKLDNGKSEPMKAAEKVEKLLDTASYRVYINIMLMLVLSAAVGIILRRLPWLGIPAAALPLFYELFLLSEKLLTKYPTGVILFTAAHAAGAIAYAALSDRRGMTVCSTAFGGAIAALMGAGVSAYVAVLSGRVTAFADTLATIRTRGVIIPDAVKPIRGAVGRIYSVCLTEGEQSARSLSSEYLESLGKSGARAAFFGSVEGDEMRTYIGIAVLFFGAAVLGFVLAARHFGTLAGIAACIPGAVTAVMLANERLSAGGIILLAASVLAAACFAAPTSAETAEDASNEEDEQTDAEETMQ